jgi:hypothetical protein
MEVFVLEDLDTRHSYEVSNPKDKVFAILGLANAAKGIKVDYNKSPLVCDILSKTLCTAPELKSHTLL